MKDKIKAFKSKIEKGLSDYMELPANDRTLSAVRGMVEAWDAIDELERCLCREGRFARADADDWNARMIHDDGTTGGHWTIAQTNAVANNLGIGFEHISEYCWNTAMNMMYSDYCTVALKYSVGTPDFYGELAKAFLFDKDAASPNAKMSAYYCGIVAAE